MSDVKYRYKGPGRLYDVPAKNMTEDEFKAMPLTSQRRARESGLYTEVETPKPAKEPAPKSAEKSSQKADEKKDGAK